jgi:hypothetical protein
MFDTPQDQTQASSESRDSSESQQTHDATSEPATHAVVDAWFSKHFHGLGNGISEELYNRVYAAKDDLKTILAQHAGDSPVS